MAVVEAGGRGGWQREVAEGGGRGRGQREVTEGGGRGRWQREVGEVKALSGMLRRGCCYWFMG